jgi:hypothetical protein
MARSAEGFTHLVDVHNTNRWGFYWGFFGNLLEICFYISLFLRGLVGTGPPGEIRTPDTQVRSLVLYPAELRAEGVKNRQAGLVSQGNRSILTLSRDNSL